MGERAAGVASGGLLYAVVAGSLASLGLALALQVRPERSVRSGSDAVGVSARLADLEQRVEALAGDLRELSAACAAAEAAPGAPGEPAPAARRAVDGGGNSLAQLLARLESRMDAIETLEREIRAEPPEDGRLAGSDPAEVARPQQALRAKPDEFPHIDWLSDAKEALGIEAVERLEDLLADPSAPLQARLEALAALREVEERLGTPVLDPATVAAALGLAQASGEDEVRARVYVALRGKSFELLRAPLLADAKESASTDVRKEATAALPAFLPDPEVAEELRWIAAHDPDPHVRDEAEDGLGRHE